MKKLEKEEKEKRLLWRTKKKKTKIKQRYSVE